MRILGMISGTSHDGIDCAVVDFQFGNGELRARIEHTSSVPYSARLRAKLLLALPPSLVTLGQVTELDTLIGQEFAAAAVASASDCGPIDFICSHGQTVFHWVEGGAVRGTLQIGQPAWIAESTMVPVISNIRVRDVVAGGQGAPLASILDVLLLADASGCSAALNLGGISNATIVRESAAPIAFDIGPANALIDAAVRMHGLHPDGFDADGMIAMAGVVHPGFLEHLLAEKYYSLPAPKSTGKELFNDTYVREEVEAYGEALAPADLVATLTELTVRTVAEQMLLAGATTLVVSGGGRRNPVIMSGLEAVLPSTRVRSSDDYGVPSDSKEAVAFALIGWLTAHGLEGTIASCTGAEGGRVLGAFSPGKSALRLPEPLPVAPSSVKFSLA